MIGVKTNIVTSVEMTGPEAHDYPYLPPLLETTAKRFQQRRKVASPVEDLPAVRRGRRSA